MTRFIRTSTGQYINVDTIESISEAQTRHGERVVLTTKSGREYYATLEFNPERLTSMVVPAAPGLFGLVPEEDDNGEIEGFYPYPVVAWRISAICDAQPEPVCPTDIGVEGVLYPDGRVEDFNGIYPNIEEFRKEVTRRRESHRAIMRERQAKKASQ